jgi:hypothetical protein
MDKFMGKIGENMKKQSDLRFDDLEEALWAVSSIAKMRGLGVVNGYDGNVFLPNNAVSQSEALTMMVRAFDLEDEAKELAEKFGLSYAALDKGYEGNGKGKGKADDFEDEEDEEDENPTFILGGQLLPHVPTSSRWALGYILLAVDQGWVKLSECNPNAPAGRAWISKVMVRALGHEAQALTKMNATLPFVDAPAVPKDCVGYVAEAVAMGLFMGYEDNTFQPNKPVTRAEMATILERFLGDELPEDMPYLAVGTIKTIAQNKITLKTQAGAELVYTVSADALIVIDHKPAAFADLKVGDVVEVLSNGSGVALLVTVKSHGTLPPAQNEVTGDIVGIATPPALTLRIDGQANRTIQVAANCTIRMGATTLSYSQLLLGDRVKVTIQNDQAVAIVVLSHGQTGQTVTGVVYGITTSSVGTDVVLQQAAAQVTVRLASNVHITYGNTNLTVNDLRIGDQVEATIQNQLATHLRILARNVQFGDMGGSIVSITQTSAETVIIVDSQGTRTTVRVTPQTVIKFGTTTLTRNDFRLGDVVRIDLTGDVAVEIRITTRGV